MRVHRTLLALAAAVTAIPTSGVAATDQEEIRRLVEPLGRKATESEFLARFQRAVNGVAPAELPAALDRALASAADPVVRQRLIFQAALALPPGEALPRLRALRTAADSEDSEDALCALAFRGDPAAVAEFEALAATPSSSAVAVLADQPTDFDALVVRGDRSLLRAWRCIEALQGSAYFERLLFDLRVSGNWRPETLPRRYPWSPGAGSAETAARLLPAWLARYPGHPGSDDMAMRLAKNALKGGNRVDAVRWSSRAATYPDQACCRWASHFLTSLLELGPTIHGPDPVEPWRNRNLIEYVRLRRTAAEVSFARAFEEAAFLAASEPHLEVSRALLARRAEAAPKGLDSGGVPLPADDPLRRVQGERIEERLRGNPACTWGKGTYPFAADGTVPEGEARTAARLQPAVEAVRLPLRRLAFQFRCWEALAELERRADRARTDEERADLLYKLGAVLYHERDSLYPVYALWGSSDANGLPNAWTLGEAGDEPWRETLVGSVSWLEWNLPHARAAGVFESVRDRFPNAAVADKAAFSAGLARMRAADDAPLRRWESWNPDLNLPHRHRLRGIEALERCAREHPSSPLARDAAAAAAWWRRKLPGNERRP